MATKQVPQHRRRYNVFVKGEAPMLGIPLSTVLEGYRYTQDQISQIKSTLVDNAVSVRHDTIHVVRVV